MLWRTLQQQQLYSFHYSIMCFRVIIVNSPESWQFSKDVSRKKKLYCCFFFCFSTFPSLLNSWTGWTLFQCQHPGELIWSVQSSIMDHLCGLVDRLVSRVQQWYLASSIYNKESIFWQTFVFWLVYSYWPFILYIFPLRAAEKTLKLDA